MTKCKVPKDLSPGIMSKRSVYLRDEGTKSIVLYDVDNEGYFRVTREFQVSDEVTFVGEIAKVRGDSTAAYKVFDALEVEGF